MSFIFREPLIHWTRRYGEHSEAIPVVSITKIYRLLSRSAPRNDGIEPSFFRENRFDVVLVLTVLLASCGGGTVDSGAALDATTGDVAGTYTGSENLSLAPVDEAAAVDTRKHGLTITVSGQGTLVLTSENGSSGQAQITNDRTFRMRADARTHFAGRCSAGNIILEGHIDAETGITGQYRSDGLTCAGESYALDGNLTAQRM